MDVARTALRTFTKSALHTVIGSDGSSIHSNEGYEYNNFLRSIKREGSSHSSEYAGLTDLYSIRSNTSMAESLRQVGREQAAASQRGSRSPKKSLLSSRRSSVSKSPSPEKSLRTRQADSPSPEKASLVLRARRNDSPGPKQSKPPNIITKVTKEDEPTSSPEVSPEVRAFRRMGASHDKLSGWAEQLKVMEERRDAKKAGPSNAGSGSGSGSSLHHRHPALRSVDQIKEKERDFSNQSWRCADAARQEQDTASRGSSNAENVPLTRSRHTSRTSLPNKALPAPPQLPAPSGYKYAPTSTSTSRTDTNSDPILHVAVRRNQHVRSKSSVASTGDEDEWTMELKRMESRERVRQIRESGAGSRSASREKSVGGSSVGNEEGEGNQEGEWGIGVAR